MSFPASPTVGQQATEGGRLFQWSGYAWEIVANVSAHAASHAASGSDPLTLSTSQITSGTLADARLSSNVVLTTDSRLSNARTPTTHASTHAAAGSDPLSLAASQISGLATVATSGSAADLSGTLADARLSSNVPLLPRLLLGWSKPSGVIDVVNRENTNNNALTVVSGTAMYVMFTPLVTTTVSQITFFSGNVAASGLTLARFGLFTFTETSSTTSAVLVARTASDTTLFTSTSTSWSRSLDTASGFPATYTLVAGTRYAVGLVTVGTGTMPQYSGKAVPAGISPLTPRTVAQIASQTDLPTSSTSIATVQGHIFARLS